MRNVHKITEMDKWQVITPATNAVHMHKPIGGGGSYERNDAGGTDP